MYRSTFALLFLCVFLPGCGVNGTPVAPASPLQPQKVQHVVVIMQENRSFDNLFHGFPGADTVEGGMRMGRSVVLQPIPFEQGTDVDHTHGGWWTDYDGGKMDGFAHDAPYPIANLPYTFVPQSETVPYWTLAKRYTLGDRMFQSNSGPSFPAHQYMIAGQSANADENPAGPLWGCDAESTERVALVGPNGTDLPGVYPCFNYKTLADILDQRGISWKYYAPVESPKFGGYIWSAYQAIRHIRFGPDWSTHVISPTTRVLSDIQNGKLAQVTWVVPALAFSDHAAKTLTAEGPDWVADITNAIGASPYWDSTVIFISWDDWGGWYDHVPPPQVDDMGLGFRVPLIVVSPYAKKNYISKQVHEFSGFLKYTEEVFGLPGLGTRDAIADDFADCFDYTQAVAPYMRVPVKHPPAYFINREETGPPDDD